jgi:hypothetical protein
MFVCVCAVIFLNSKNLEALLSTLLREVVLPSFFHFENHHAHPRTAHFGIVPWIKHKTNIYVLSLIGT